MAVERSSLSSTLMGVPWAQIFIRSLSVSLGSFRAREIEMGEWLEREA